MNRDTLALAVHELGRRLELDYFYIIGSAAIFAELRDSREPAITETRDVDVIPWPPEGTDTDVVVDQIDLFFGEGSDFDVQNGFYNTRCGYIHAEICTARVERTRDPIAGGRLHGDVHGKA